MAAEAAAAAGPAYAQVDVDDLLDDPDLERLHAERLAAMQREAEKRSAMQRKGHGALLCYSLTAVAGGAVARAPPLHRPRTPAQRAHSYAAPSHVGAGSYEEIAEGEFLEVVTQTERVVAHFFHREFERCRIMDKHLSALCSKHFGTRFIKLSAPVRCWTVPGMLCDGARGGWSPGRSTSEGRNAQIDSTQPLRPPHVLLQDSPFFVEKLQVRMLPCVVMFVSGIAVDRIVGFDTLGASDDFPTSQVWCVWRVG